MWDHNQLESRGHSCLIHFCFPSTWYTVPLCVPSLFPPLASRPTRCPCNPAPRSLVAVSMLCFWRNGHREEFPLKLFLFIFSSKGRPPGSFYVIVFFLRRDRKCFPQKAKTLKNVPLPLRWPQTMPDWCHNSPTSQWNAHPWEFCGLWFSL